MNEVEWITIPELAKRIGMSREGVYRRARVNDIPGLVKMGGRWLVNYNAFVAASQGTSSLPASPYLGEDA